MNPEIKSAPKYTPGQIEPIIKSQKDGVDFVKCYHTLGSRGNLIWGGNHNTLWQEFGDEEVVLGDYLRERGLGSRGKASLSIREICQARLGRGPWEDLELRKPSLKRWLRYHYQQVAWGRETVEGIGADTGMIVLRGGLTNA